MASTIYFGGVLKIAPVGDNFKFTITQGGTTATYSALCVFDPTGGCEGNIDGSAVAFVDGSSQTAGSKTINYFAFDGGPTAQVYFYGFDGSYLGTLFEKTPILCALQPLDAGADFAENVNQLILFDI